MLYYIIHYRTIETSGYRVTPVISTYLPNWMEPVLIKTKLLIFFDGYYVDVIWLICHAARTMFTGGSECSLPLQN